MDVAHATDAAAWDGFLAEQRYRPFLQSWTMGDVYADCGQEPVRLLLREGSAIAGICFGHVVNARRGKHLAIPYGPVLSWNAQQKAEGMQVLIQALAETARAKGCSFLRISPFAREADPVIIPGALRAPLHLLAEHVWYLPLRVQDPWQPATPRPASAMSESPFASQPRSAEELRSQLRKTTRNLIGRAEREGVTVEASPHPEADLPDFLRLHEETRKRHGFTPYTEAFFRAQLTRFAARGEATLYLARYQGEAIAASIHVHAFGETSYHHGASSHAHAKLPASYLLQWTAVTDALKRGDHVYNFWGIAPVEPQTGKPVHPRHPFSGVTLFKTGFGGKLVNLQPCMDIPLAASYTLTRAFETFRKWRRGF